MSIDISLGTPLAEALNAAIQPKLQELGLGSGGADDSALAEYVILMLVNGKNQQQIAQELSGDLLHLEPDDPTGQEFSRWLFEQIASLASQMVEAQPQADDSLAGPVSGAGEGDMDTDMNPEPSTLNAPTGPRSMRNGSGMQRGGREKRLMGHVNKAMDRTGDAALHRVRGQTGGERINSHARTPPTGPRGGGARQPRPNNRAANMQAGMNNMNPAWAMQGQGPGQMDLMSMLEQQNQMMFQLSQQLMSNQNGNGGHNGQQRRGKSLFDRVNNPQRQHDKRAHHNRQGGAGAETSGASEDVDMAGDKPEPPNPDDTICKYNLHCTNKECKFAHQSPAAPPGTTIDVHDHCSFGAACKNRKCVARHPSPATKLAHQGEQDCKFFPNCQNPHCPFKHPSMPLCRNGAGCTTPNCKFTHVKTKCKFNPCLNRQCPFQHDDGQQGEFKDKVWTAEGGDEHVSERKFVDDGADSELVKPEEAGVNVKMEQTAQDAEVIG